jgi:hypothetical protein
MARGTNSIANPIAPNTSTHKPATLAASVPTARAIVALVFGDIRQYLIACA